MRSHLTISRLCGFPLSAADPSYLERRRPRSSANPPRGFFWPNEDPVGKSWQFRNAIRTVVGVVKDSGANLINDSSSVEASLPIEPASADTSAIIVHIRGNPAPLIRDVPSLGESMGEQLGIISMLQRRANALDSEQKLITIILSLGLIATLLAASGVFATVAFSVAQRTREIGIRVARRCLPAPCAAQRSRSDLRPRARGYGRRDRSRRRPRQGRQKHRMDAQQSARPVRIRACGQNRRGRSLYRAAMGRRLRIAA